jgi:hypothetical protein
MGADMSETLVTMETLKATAASVVELAEGVHDLLAHDPPVLNRQQTLGILAHLSRTRERLQRVSDWSADAGPPIVDEDEQQAAEGA